MSTKKFLSAFMACVITCSVVYSAAAGVIPIAFASTAVENPVPSMPAGRYEESVSVALTSATPDAEIYYTLDGTLPDETSPKYNGTPIVLTESANISVIATKDGVWSQAWSYGYIIKTTEQPLLKFAAMSDIHIGPGTPEWETLIRKIWTSNFDVLSSILPNPDTIVVAGDIINDNGDGKGPDHTFAYNILNEQLVRKNWTNMPIQIAMGNHDASVADVRTRYPAEWFTTQSNGYYEKVIKGYSFFFLNANNYNSDTTQRNWLKGRLAALTADPANLNKPIFITLHHPISGTVMDGIAGSNPNLNTDLQNFPQVVVLSGHSHLNINDERSIYQKDFTAINVGSMSYAETDSGYSLVTKEDGLKEDHLVPVSESQIIEVYQDRIEIERIDYNGDPGNIRPNWIWKGAEAPPYRSAGALAGKKWVVKLTGNTNAEIKSNFTYTTSKSNKTAPQFPANPDLKVVPGADNVPVLSFRQAMDDQNMHHYLIKLFNERTAQEEKTYSVLSDYYFSPIPNKMNIPMPGLDPTKSYVINVSAVDSYGNVSTPVKTIFRTQVTPPELTPIDPSTMWNQLVSDMKFNGNLNDDAAGATGLATLAGNVTYVAGKSGQAASIAAGNANYIDLGDRSDLKFGNGDFTVSFWHAGNLTGDQTVISNKDWGSPNNAGWYIGPSTTNNMTLNMGDGTNRVDYSAQSVGTDLHQFTITVDRTNNTAKTYVDGVEKATQDITLVGASSMDTPYHVIIGADGNKSKGGATVTLDDLKIWKRALSATEAKALSDSYLSTKLYTYEQLNAKLQEAEKFTAYVAGTKGLSLPQQAQNELQALITATKAISSGESANVIDQGYLDLMWALQTAQNAIVYTFIPKTEFSIDSFSSYASNESAEAKYILDGQESTVWISKWVTPAATFPHWIIIDMKDTYKISGIQRKSRPTQSLEAPNTFEFYASDNVADLSDPAFLGNAANKASGAFGKTWTGRVFSDFVALNNSVQGRYVKFVITGSYNTNPTLTFASMSEIDFTGDKVPSARLKELKINDVLVDRFEPNKLDYSLNVPYNVTDASVTYTVYDPQTTVVVNGGSNLQVGNNVVTVTVTAPNARASSYVINVNRLDIPPAYLSDLRVNSETLSGFTWDKLDYSLSVPYETTVTNITYTSVNLATSVVVVGGNDLSVGVNTITVTSTAEDGTKCIYNILITRHPLAASTDSSLLDLRVNGTTLEGFASDKLSYSLSVTHETTVIHVVYTATDPEATVMIAGGEYLVVGVNAVTVTVTAEDGTKRVYSMMITRQPAALSSNTNLFDLRVNTIAINGFAPNKLSYMVEVPYGTTVATVTYSAEHVTSKVVVTGGSSLSVGSNRISVLVTAQDGTTKEYVIIVYRLSDSSEPSLPSEVTPVKPELPKDVATIKDEDLQKNSASVPVTLAEGQNHIVVPMAQAYQLQGRSIIVQAHDVKLIVPGDLLISASNLLPSPDNSAAITVKIEPISGGQADQTLREASRKDNGLYTLGGQVLDLSIIVTDTAGKQYEMNNGLNKPVTITFPIPAGLNPKLVGIYELHEDGSLVYIGGTHVNDNTAIEVEIDRLSQYAVISLEKNYNDVTSLHWAYETIQELSAQHIVNGITNSSYEPTKAVSRAEFASLLVRTLGLKSAEAPPFGDVAGNAWYAGEVSAAYKSGIITGNSKQKFDPNLSITREEMAIMLVRAYELRTGVKLEQASPEISDASEISDWALSYVNRAINAKLLTGRQEGLFVPAEYMTRAEAAQAVYNLLK
ncbi:hypothetical protein GC098_16715 [Paenibacillus sp. LMG 31458]|uniref:Metallophosphoesterase n=1 Tax=Paenibacillus phytorum TaxID=2654977 RepID=A0ABX1XWZ1_9BACL|nr:cadherin-like beta sandwich domain-containing protein [Paenibacillus phytorum]NOU73042.1 hypothetical protein [Paenibacillus phytorum]